MCPQRVQDHLGLSPDHLERVQGVPQGSMQTSVCCVFPHQVYLHIPGSEKLILELPLVIGTVPFSGVSSRTSSMCSRASSSWASLPSAPPSYSNIHRNLRVEGPRTPLLHDYDGADDEDDDGGLFIRIPEGGHPPPPAYSEVRLHPPVRTGGAMTAA